MAATLDQIKELLKQNAEEYDRKAEERDKKRKSEMPLF